MFHMVLGVNGILENAGLIAGFVIGLFFLVWILLLVALNLLMAFLTAWLKEKAELLKMLRPAVDSVNQARAAVESGVPANEDQSPIVRAVASLPSRLEAVDQKVEQATDKVAGGAIEFRARASQVKAVAKAFFLPGLVHRERERDERLKEGSQEFESPGYRRLMREASEAATGVNGTERAGSAGNREITNEQLKNVATH